MNARASGGSGAVALLSRFEPVWTGATREVCATVCAMGVQHCGKVEKQLHGGSNILLLYYVNYYYKMGKQQVVFRETTMFFLL